MAIIIYIDCRFLTKYLAGQREQLYEILLPPANEVCEGYVFTGVCLSTTEGGCAWLLGGCVWFFCGGACVVFAGGWFFPGGVRGFSGGGCMHGFF